MVERFDLVADAGSTRLEYTGEVGTDFLAAGAAWGAAVAKKWVATVRDPSTGSGPRQSEGRHVLDTTGLAHQLSSAWTQRSMSIQRLSSHSVRRVSSSGMSARATRRTVTRTGWLSGTWRASFANVG